MTQPARSGDSDQARVMLGLLDSVERDGARSQRLMASELGVALGLVNAYLKRCIKKGLIKASQAPARRYVYYLTPQGFAEKSRLTIEYLSYSFSFFRQAKDDYLAIFAAIRSRDLGQVVLAGKSDLAEIAAICAMQCGVDIVALVDDASVEDRFMGIPVVATVDDLVEPSAVVIVTDLLKPGETYRALVSRYGCDRVYVPELLKLRANGDGVAR
jgi:DNA-binding MarR family transcriptional regulator